MEESKVLESAIKSCKQLERSLFRSITVVRRLNIRYNVEWLLKNYNSYISNIWSQYQCVPEMQKINSKTSKSSKTPIASNQSTRSSQELCGSSRKINYKLIKIKRSMEAMMLQVQRAIEIGNRQRNFIHFSLNGQDLKTRICCH